MSDALNSQVLLILPFRDPGMCSVNAVYGSEDTAEMLPWGVAAVPVKSGTSAN